MTPARDTSDTLRGFLGELETSLREDTGNGVSLGLLIIYLENLDKLMSAHGYSIGSAIVDSFGRRLSTGVRTTDRVVRIADSKFAVIVRSLRNDGIAQLAAQKLGDICRRPIAIDNREFSISVRVGVAIGCASTPDAESLHQLAEGAVLTAIAEHRDHAMAEAGQADRAGEWLALEQELDEALRQSSFELNFQPKVSAHDYSPCGAEALIRWNNANRGPVAPDTFIPLTDRPGRMEALTAFILNTGIRQAMQWPQQLALAVNVSAAMLKSDELVDLVGNALGVWSFPPERLILEVTEGALITDPAASFAALAQLRQLGVQVSIDDFGTGYSSLAYFKDIPANEIKIDKRFVDNICTDAGDQRIVSAIIQLARSFEMVVTAEGIESPDQAELLSELGCNRLQGYLFSKPLSQAAFLDWLNSQATRRRAGVS